MPSPFPGRSSGEAPNALRDAPIACHELDLEGIVVWVNPAGCRLLGYEGDQILGRPIWEFVAPNERANSRDAVGRKLSVEAPLGVFERTYTRPDGSILMLEIHEHYRRGADGAIVGMRSFLLDITARKRAEEDLRKVQEDLELRIRERTQELELLIDFLRREIDERRLAEIEHRKLEAQVQYSQRLESMGVLAGGVAHKFNNLLTSIMGYASLAAIELPRGGSRARDHLDQVLSAAASAAELTQQMLAYSGRGQFVLESVDISKMVEGTARLLESLVSKKATLTMDLSADSLPIEADAAQIRQVLINLATNASDALADRGGEIAIRTGAVWAEGGELPSLHSGHLVPAGLYSYLEVADTGCGMDEQTLGKIFDPFFTTKFTGRGLGLPAVMGIVRAHRGSIRVTSVVGEGTVVRAFFPAMDEGDPLLASAEADPAPVTLTGTVLVVDDEESILRLAKAVLEDAGLSVLTAKDGIDALRVFRENADAIQAVLLDLTMPGMDGAEVFRHCLQIRPEIRVVLCSGYNEYEVTSRLGEHRPAAFLRKPYQPQELLSLLSSLW